MVRDYDDGVTGRAPWQSVDGPRSAFDPLLPLSFALPTAATQRLLPVASDGRVHGPAHLAVVRRGGSAGVERPESRYCRLSSQLRPATPRRRLLSNPWNWRCRPEAVVWSVRTTAKNTRRARRLFTAPPGSAASLGFLPRLCLTSITGSTKARRRKRRGSWPRIAPCGHLLASVRRPNVGQTHPGRDPAAPLRTEPGSARAAVRCLLV
jgi:hypothetical protein